MSEKSLRYERINELIREHVGNALVKGVSFKRDVLVTITIVRVQSDLRRVRIGLSVFPESEESYVLDVLHKELYHVQGLLNKQLSINPLPRINFSVDKTESQANQVEVLLKQLKEEGLVPDSGSDKRTDYEII